jgi:hypothetical protein
MTKSQFNEDKTAVAMDPRSIKALAAGPANRTYRSDILTHP